MSEIALDEVSVLSAIYCERDEFALLEQSGEKCDVFGGSHILRNS